MLTALGLLSATAPSALASASSFTWSGAAPFGAPPHEEGADWSLGANWKNGMAPKNREEIGILRFPALPNPPCTVEEEIGGKEEDACYFSENDVEGLRAESMIVEGDDYLIAGDALTLGKAGLTVAPATSVSSGFDWLVMPFDLAETQTWRFQNPSGKFGATQVRIAGPVTSVPSDTLTIELSNEAEPYLEQGVEVGPLRITGSNPSEAGVFNGAFPLGGTNVNGRDGEPVSVEHIFVFGSGVVGPLTSNHAEIAVGASRFPAGGIEVAGARFDPSSAVSFQVMDSGTTGNQDYAQLTSTGPIQLQSATIEVVVRPPVPGKPCPVLTRGQTYTFVSTSGQLSGSFANAPESGPELPIRVAEGCASSSQKMRIHYHESGGVETVTGTVEEAAQTQQEEEAKKLAEQRGRQLAEEEAAAKKKQEEETAKQGVLSFKESAPDATIAGASLNVSPSGMFVIKIKCPSGESSCTGTISVRTLHAVVAGAAGREARQKAAVLTLASGKFTIEGGQTKAVTLRLSGRARALLARSHQLRALATIVAHNPTGGAHTTQTTVTLHASKPRR